jgi:hypothetical protein
MPALAQIPYVELVPVLAVEEQFAIQTVLNHVRSAPFTGN